MKKIVIDLNCSETNYEEFLQGVEDFLKNNTNCRIVLVGNALQAKHILSKRNVSFSFIDFYDVKETLLDEDNPTLVLKEKRNTSLVKSFELLKKDDETIGLISAGPTGGLLISSIFHLGLVKGLKTPSLSSVLYSFTGKPFILADCGANLEVDAQTFVKFAEINSKYAAALCSSYPRVALLNVGKESKKGNANLKNTYEVLKNNSQVNFVGNIEGFDIFLDKADVILTDGITGNVVLKLAESMAKGFKGMFDPLISDEKRSDIDSLIENNFYYSSKGGAMLLGAKKPIIKLHGKSDASAVTNCINRLVEINNGLN